MTVVIGTAGHIDHGKTTLLRALTGTDADRLPEEQRRGLTIDVGYAHVAPDGGPEIDFVDMPGHDRLVGNMLVGAGEVDACLLVVAADDGPRAQTWEHLGLIDALGIQHGVVAVTKTDLVGSDRIAHIVDGLREPLSRTTLAAAPIVTLSAASGQGLDQLRTVLAKMRDAAIERDPDPDGTQVRLSIDRAFSVRGRGVVVTGSSRGGSIGNRDTLSVLPGPSTVRVRGLQVHDADVEQGPRGGRLAIAVAGEDVGELRRGQVLASPGAADVFAPRSSDRLLVALSRPAVLPGRRGDETWPPADGAEARLHVGTDQVDAVAGRAGRDEVLLADDRAIAMLRLDRPVAVAIGDRFVLRRPPPAGLIAGGVVLDAAPVRGRSRRRQDPERLARLAVAVAARDRVAVSEALLDLHGILADGAAPELARDVAAASQAAALDVVGTLHEAHPAELGPSLAATRSAAADGIRRAVSASTAEAAAAAMAVVEASVDSGVLVREGDVVRLPQHQPPARDPKLDAALDRLVLRLDVPAPPSLRTATDEAGCSMDDVRELERTGRIVRVDDDLAWSADAYAALRDHALELAAAEPLTPAALRDATGTSRKFVMALLEDLDRRGILRRTPAGHVRGPRAGET